MFEEAQLYSPVTQREDGKVEVHLGQDHPGFNDPAYRTRRNEIAAAAMAWSPGDLHQADARLVGHQRDETRVEVVDRTGHVVQNLPGLTGRC